VYILKTIPKVALVTASLSISTLAPTSNAWYNKGLAAEKLGKYSEAIKCFEQAIKIDPKHLEAKWASSRVTMEKERKKGKWEKRWGRK
jgi:tetratricopeptide (TPR) repeat protein